MEATHDQRTGPLDIGQYSVEQERHHGSSAVLGDEVVTWWMRYFGALGGAEGCHLHLRLLVALRQMAFPAKNTDRTGAANHGGCASRDTGHVARRDLRRDYCFDLFSKAQRDMKDHGKTPVEDSDCLCTLQSVGNRDPAGNGYFHNQPALELLAPSRNGLDRCAYVHALGMT